MNYPYYIYGSQDSTDTDVMVQIPKEIMPLVQEDRKILMNKIKVENQLNWNCTLIVIKNGYISDTIYPKSWIDSLNNSLWNTYHFHNQKYKLPIIGLMKRNKLLAIYKAVRTVLAMFTRTELRSSIKPYMNGIHDFKHKLKCLTLLDFTKFNNFNQSNTLDVDIWKIFAFYIAQNISLIEHDIEIYSKSEVIKYYPNLYNFIYRKELTINDKINLNNYLYYWITLINNFGVYTSLNEILKCNDEIIDMKNEIFI